MKPISFSALFAILWLALFAVSSAAQTCIKETEGNGQACLNMTAYNWGDGLGPWDPWTGSICAELTESGDQVEVTFEAASYWLMWEAYLDVEASSTTLPVNVEDFQQQVTDLGGVSSHTFTLDLDPMACDATGEYTLTFAAHSKVGDPCIPFNGSYIWGTDYPAWGMDVDNPQYTEDGTKAFFDLTVKCDCSEPTRTNVVVPEPEPEPETEPPKTSSASGDPHFKTWTGDKFDYHGECDLVLLDHPSFNDGQGLKVHVRTTRVKYFSYIEQIAVQIGDDVLEFDNDVENFLINGDKAEDQRKWHTTMLGGFPIRRDPKALSIRLFDGGIKSHNGHNIAKIDLIRRTNGFPAVVVDGGETDMFKGSLGLLGDWESGKRLARDGTTEMNDPDATAYALEWQVRDSEPMLFKEARFPQFPTTCTPPKKMMSNRLGMSNAKKEAEKACSEWK